jgi:hypothetical protein
VDRRDLVRLGATVAAGAAALALAPPARAQVRPATAVAPPAPLPGVLDVFVNDGYLPMVDGALVYHRGFGDRPTDPTDARPSLTLPPHVFTADGRVVASRTYPLGAPVPPLGRPTPARRDPAAPGEFIVHRKYWASFFPERTLLAETGSRIKLRVHNRLSRPHELALHNAAGTGFLARTKRIAPGGAAVLDIAAPAPGVYIFSDPGNAPVERVLGLFGVLVVVPTASKWLPYPGGPEFERQWVWICHDVDDRWARTEANGGTVDPRRTPAVPRYFTLNGRSGFQSLGISTDEAANHVREEETLISGYPRDVDVRNFSRRPGQLVRLVNPGIVKHQMHFHGNHVWTVRRNDMRYPRSGALVDAAGHVVLQQWEDVVELDPMDCKDSVIPIKRPPDALDVVWRNRTTDWEYPMHCHAEPSQTAAGGMYPGGLVAHWTLAHPGGAS